MERGSELTAPLRDKSGRIISATVRTSMFSALKAEKKQGERDPLFDSDEIYTWTVSDQSRLLSIDGLQSRTLEYHNNVHQRIPELAPIAHPTSHDIVAQILVCKPGISERPFSATPKMVSTVVQRFKSQSTETDGAVIWVNMLNLSILPSLCEFFHISTLCAENFFDLRCHSAVTQAADGGCLVSICHFYMSPFTFKTQMFKIFIYLSPSVVITYTAELMPDGRDSDDCSAVPESSVCNSVLSKWEVVAKRCCELGAFYMFYRLAAECLTFQDPILEFFSRTLFYFKGQLKLSLSHQEKVAFMKKMHITMSGIHLLDRNTMKVWGLVKELSQKATNPKILPLISSDLLSKEIQPYMYDLQDLFYFADDCLNTLHVESQILSTTMDNISQLRANNNAMVLSLIATIFLPVTFFTGVYGMNFQVDGGYTIGMVNSANGPLIFYCMCIAVLLLSSAYFLSMGWIEIYPIYRYFLSLCFGDRRVQRWERDGKVGSLAVAQNAKGTASPASSVYDAAAGNPLNHSLASDTLSATSSLSGGGGTYQVPLSTNPSLVERFTFMGGSTAALPRETMFALDEEERRRLATIRKRHQVQEVNSARFRNSIMALHTADLPTVHGTSNQSI